VPTSRPLTTRQMLDQMSASLQQQADSIAQICAILEVQFKRIVTMQAELDVVPTARKCRATLRMLLQPPALLNRNGAGKT
jgi:hypothetical protein